MSTTNITKTTEDFWSVHDEMKRREPTVLQNYSHLPSGERVELLIGRLSGLLAPCRQLANELRTRKGAVQSRADLDTLLDMVTGLYCEVTSLRPLMTEVKSCQAHRDRVSDPQPSE